MRTVGVTVLVLVALAVLTGIGLWILSENRQLALRLAVLQRDAEQLRQDAVGAAAIDTALRGEIRRLERELSETIATRDAVLARIDEHRRELEVGRADDAARMHRATKAPPEGVRLAMLTINELLAADGFGGMRFLYAAKLDEHALHDVEFFEHRADRFASAVWTAARVTFELDRATGILTLRCFDGEVVGDGESRRFPEDGEAVTLDSVTVESWEARLPFLVVASGQSPHAKEAARARPSIDPATAAIWMERLDQLFEASGTDLRLRIGRVRDLREGRFTDVLVHGYDEGRVLSSSMQAKSLEVCVDGAAGTVELVLRDGVLMQSGGDIAIPEAGYRILLPALQPSAARELMLGMVVDA